jgi:hypothetical protein
MAPPLRETAEAVSTLQADQMGDSSRAGSNGQTVEENWEERGGAKKDQAVRDEEIRPEHDAGTVVSATSAATHATLEAIMPGWRRTAEFVGEERSILRDLIRET